MSNFFVNSRFLLGDIVVLIVCDPWEKKEYLYLLKNK